MIQLYFNPHSRALITKWMLDECGVAYTLVPIDLRAREHKQPAFLAINPAGKLPALVDGETRLFENTAIGLYLADKYPQHRLAPAVDAPERGRYLSLMVYATSQLEPAMGDALLGQETSPMRGWTDFEAAQDVIEQELGDGPYLFGDWFTAADLMIGSMFIWRRAFKGHEPGYSERPALKAYADRLLARPLAMKMGG